MTTEKKSTQNSSKSAETVGCRIAAAREAKGLSVSEVAAATRMMEKHVHAIEADDFAALGPAIYAKGFIKLYADFLGLDTASILSEVGRKIQRKNEAPLIKPPQPVSERKAEITEAVQERVEKVVSAARKIPVRLPPAQVKKILLNASAFLALLLLVILCVVGIRSCVSSMKERQTTPRRSAHQSQAVLEEPPEPYLDSP